LAAVAAHLRNRETQDADTGQGLSDVVQLERLDDRGDQLHGSPLPATACSGAWVSRSVPRRRRPADRREGGDRTSDLVTVRAAFPAVPDFWAARAMPRPVDLAA